MKKTTKKITEQSAEPTIVVRCGDSGGDSHEPPIGVGDAPVYIDPPHDLPPDGTPLEDGLKTSYPGYYKYKFAREIGQKPYFNLETVKVLTEKGDATGEVVFTDYNVPRDRISNLQLWIGDGAGEPKIIVRGKNGGSILSALPLEERQTAEPPKNNRKKRYYFPDPVSRIVRWAIVDESGAVLNDPSMENGAFADAGGDRYYFYVLFAHD